MKAYDRRHRQQGFTLMEMLVVISIMLILVSIAIPAYNRTIIRARETVLKQDLFTLRSVINQYTDDKEKAPQSLSDLVSAGYLTRIPPDPITNSVQSWQVQQEDVLQSVDQQEPGITNVHSGNSRTSSEGTPYSEW
jgi:general secretion pathway protein G